MPEADGPRQYSSPLRDRQAAATRESILDALTELLAQHRADEVSTREIAEVAGVSQRTVYRHFPDRQSLIEGLADRIELKAQEHTAEVGDGHDDAETLDNVIEDLIQAFQVTDEHHVEATAEAVLNADPRRLSAASQARTESLAAVVARTLPELEAKDQHQVTALFRCLDSVQTWLRMREEFGLSASESGPLVAWALRTLLAELRSGELELPARVLLEP